MAAGTERPDLRDLGQDRLAAWLAERGHPSYRASQILGWLYKRPVGNVQEMQNLPARLREELEKDFTLCLPRVARRLDSEDGAVKLALSLADGEIIESVWMPEQERTTICVSTQAGCRMGCRFCATGQGGLRRNLTPSEIVGQIITATRELGPVSNIVLMGMGEPLDNLDHVLAALESICSLERIAMAPRRITLSTLGLPGRLETLPGRAPGIKLAISLHSAVQQTRDRLAPGARILNLADLKRVLWKYPLGPQGRLTFEVVLIGGVNDGPDEARALARWADGLRGKVNLIPFNPFPGCDFPAPPEDAVLSYQRVLREAGLLAFIRRSRGGDIMAACGQLRLSSDLS